MDTDTKPTSIEALVVTGIYYLYEGDYLVYIGKGSSVYERIFARRSEGRFFFDGFIVVPVAIGDLDRVYTEELLKHNPPANFDYPAPITNYLTIKQLKDELGIGAVAIKRLIKERNAIPQVFNCSMYYNVEDLK